MADSDALAAPFEDSRGHLRAVAYRMLGSRSEADDAVQEAWLRVSRADTAGIANLRGWLTTVVSRVCLDMLRSRKSRREEPLDAQGPEPAAPRAAASPEHEAVLADSLGVALLVVLDTLAPAERLAFVLHDMFAMPFEEIAAVVGRSPAAARQLASRARRRVQGAPVTDVDLAGQRAVVAAFLTALRGGDLEALLAVLDPDVVIRADRGIAPPEGSEQRGAATWARQAVLFGKGARAVQPMLIDGEVGLVLAPHGKLMRLLQFVVVDGRITEVEVVGDPERLARIEIAALPGEPDVELVRPGVPGGPGGPGGG